MEDKIKDIGFVENIEDNDFDVFKLEDEKPPCDVKIRPSLFKDIDRDQEDILVNKYQKTRRLSKKQIILQDLYEMRRQTLQIWAKKYAYLCTSEEDLFEDISIIWFKCVRKYEYKPKNRAVRTRGGKFVFSKKGGVKTVFKRTPFNTFLYTALRHYMSNAYKSIHGQKKLDQNGNPIESNLLSIDYEYCSNDNSNRKINFKDILPSTEHPTSSNAIANSLIDEISNGDNEIKEALNRFVSDSHIKKISNACQNIVEKIVLDSAKDIKIFSGHKSTAKKRLKEIITKSNKYSRGFKLLHFRFNKTEKTVTFEVKRRDTVVLRKTMRAFERYKKKSEGKQFV